MANALGLGPSVAERLIEGSTPFFPTKFKIITVLICFLEAV